MPRTLRCDAPGNVRRANFYCKSCCVRGVSVLRLIEVVAGAAAAAGNTALAAAAAARAAAEAAVGAIAGTGAAPAAGAAAAGTGTAPAAGAAVAGVTIADATRVAAIPPDAMRQGASVTATPILKVAAFAG